MMPPLLKHKPCNTGNKPARPTTIPAAGFTLLETLLAIAISALLAFRVVPAFGSLVEGMRIKGASGSLSRSLRLARQEAILRQTPARICPSRDGYVCTGSGNWSKGWIVYLDRTGGPGRDPADTILSVQPALPHIDLHYNRGSMISTNARGRISQNGRMRICGQASNRSNVELVMVHSGRLRLASTRSGC